MPLIPIFRKCQPFWQYEDITRTDWTIRSADQIDVFLQHVVSVFAHSLPHAHLDKRWAQLALQLALSCSSRHYAGRSLQIFRWGKNSRVANDYDRDHILDIECQRQNNPSFDYNRL